MIHCTHRNSYGMGSNQPPGGETCLSTSAGPQVFCSYLGDGRGGLQRRIDDSPGLLDVVLSGEQGGISRHRVTQHPFIGTHVVRDRLPAPRDFCGYTNRLVARSREVQTEGNRIVGADSEPEMIRLQVAILEHRGWTPEPHQHFGDGDWKAFAGPNIKRNATPPPGIDLKLQGRVSFHLRIRSHSLFFDVISKLASDKVPSL